MKTRKQQLIESLLRESVVPTEFLDPQGFQALVRPMITKASEFRDKVIKRCDAVLKRAGIKTYNSSSKISLSQGWQCSWGDTLRYSDPFKDKGYMEFWCKSPKKNWEKDWEEFYAHIKERTSPTRLKAYEAEMNRLTKETIESPE